MDESKFIQKDRASESRHRHPRHVPLVTDAYASAAQQAVAAISEPAAAKQPHDGRRLRRVGTLRSPRTGTPAVLAHGLQQLVIDDNTPRSKCSGTSQPIDVVEPQTLDSGAHIVNDQGTRSHGIEPPQKSPKTRAVAGTSDQATTPALSSGVRPKATTFRYANAYQAPACTQKSSSDPPKSQAR